MKEWMQNAIQSKERIAIPIMTHPGIELIGHNVKEAVTQGDVHFAAIKELYNRYPSAATTVIMDLTVEAEAFGAEVTYPENEVPSVSCRLLHNMGEVQALQIPSLDKGRIPQYLKANRLTAEYVKDKPVLAGCIGPYSLAGRLYDMTELMMAMYTDPQTVHILLDKCTSFLINYCNALKQTGVNGVIIAEPAAGLLSNDDCYEYSSIYVKKIIENIQDNHFSIILHNCGNTGHCTQAMIATGAASYHFGNRIEMIEALHNCPSEVLVMGNLDPVGIFKMASAREVEIATTELLERTAAFNNFVLSTGCDVPPKTPEANIEAFYRALNNYNKK